MFFKKRAGERGRNASKPLLTQLGEAATLIVPPRRQLDPQPLKYKTHTGTHKSVQGGVILNAGLLF